MSKRFTVDDIVEVTKIAGMMGVDAIWCTILFKGCKNPVEFYAWERAEDDFQREMYKILKEEKFGKVRDGSGEWYITIPPDQYKLEEAALEKRLKLLVESDFSDLPVTQARLSDKQKTEWAEYRQALRDMTAQEGFPWDVDWPVKPK